jgi:predicted DNA-binding transcriptional regulator AlpA
MAAGPIRISPFPKPTKKYYVYTLAYPNGEVFYVGKGTGDRIHQHEYEAARSGKEASYYYNNPEKHAIIRGIWAQGGQVKKEIVFETDIEQDAYIYEWTLINQGIGLVNKKTSGRRKAIEPVPKPAPSPRTSPPVHTTRVEVREEEIYLSANEAYERLGISRQALDGYVERGQLTKYKRTLARRVFFKEAEINRLLELRPENHKHE